jgi:WD40 repeat protein
LYEIWSMVVSNDGKYVLTSSHDKSMRLWEKTSEPLVLEDERETVRGLIFHHFSFIYFKPNEFMKGIIIF